MIKIEEINKDKLKKIDGGGLSFLAGVGIVSLVIFAVGVIDGYVNPEKCRN